MALVLLGVLTKETIGAEIAGGVSSYYDTRGMPTASVTLSAPTLPLGTKFFGFTDFFMSKEDNAQFDNAYGEYKLSKTVWQGINISGEYNRDFSYPNGIHRLGISYEPNLSKIMKNGFFGMTFYPFATENDGAQVVLYGNKNFRNGDMYISGFFDYNFRPNNVVTEVQLGKRIKKDFYFVVEGRYNGFQKKDSLGVGVGLEIKF
ncbi:hypothetical protein HYW75_01860 [Candidatus Pacearchaeota archaeon]|nr:hypothetical protein [Candidatus Pacearchaeota archaeon]